MSPAEEHRLSLLKFRFPYLSLWQSGGVSYFMCTLYISLCVSLQQVLSEGWFPVSRNFYLRNARKIYVFK